MRNQVVGFMFNTDHLDRVDVLLCHTGDTLEGVSGAFEDGETINEAMVRVFQAKTGINTVPAQWRNFCIYNGFLLSEVSYTTTYFFRAFGPIYRSKTPKVKVISVRDLSKSEAIKNVRWLIPLALDFKVNCPVMIVETRSY